MHVQYIVIGKISCSGWAKLFKENLPETSCTILVCLISIELLGSIFHVYIISCVCAWPGLANDVQ